jgi:hypothetical protein
MKGTVAAYSPPNQTAQAGLAKPSQAIPQAQFISAPTPAIPQQPNAYAKNRPKGNRQFALGQLAINHVAGSCPAFEHPTGGRGMREGIAGHLCGARS